MYVYPRSSESFSSLLFSAAFGLTSQSGELNSSLSSTPLASSGPRRERNTSTHLDLPTSTRVAS